MRRVVVVALICFAVGLAVLLWLDQRKKETASGPAEPAPPQSIGSRGEVVTVPDKEGQVTEISLSGPLRWSRVDPDTLVRKHEFRARDSRSLKEGAVEVEGLELEIYGGEGEDLGHVVHAAHGQGYVKIEQGQPRVDETRPIVLEEVTAEVQRGMEFAPLVLTVPRAEELLSEHSLRSDDPIDVKGRGLQAHGQGLLADDFARTLRIERQPHAELTLPDGAHVTLDAAGPLTFAERPDLGPGLASVEAGGGAFLKLEAAEPLELEAPLVRLIGRVVSDPDRFVPVRAEAEGGVELRPRDGRFQGQSAEVAFDELGHLASGKLLGAPRFWVDLHRVDLSGFGGQHVPAGDQSLPAEGNGHSVLELTFGARTTFSLDGPASLRLPSLDADLESQGSISGSREEGLGYSALEAIGGVVATSGELTLEAPEMGVEALAETNAAPFARLTCRGVTRVRGPSKDGRHLDLTARDGLIATRRGDSYAIPRANQVDFTVTGESPLRGRADEVLDLDGDTLAFEARGDVELDEPRGTGRGDRLVSHGKDHAALYGVPGVQARLMLPQGRLTADFIERSGEHLSAWGAARAEVELENFSTDLKARWIEAGPGAPIEGEDPEQAPDWVLDAGGDVDAEVNTVDARHVVRSQSLRLSADEVEHGSTRRLAPAGLIAQGQVDAVYDSAVWLHASEVDRMTYDREGRARLVPLLGERVRVEGALRERGATFTLSAGDIEYGQESLHATAPDIEVAGVDLPLLGEERSGDDPRLRAVAGNLLVDRRSLLFSDQVSITRVAGQDVSWSLDAERVQLLAAQEEEAPQQPSGTPPEQGAEQKEGAGEQNTQPQQEPAKPQQEESKPQQEEGAKKLPLTSSLSELYAWGGIVASSADGLQVQGDQLEVSRLDDRVTVTGAPAAVVGRGVIWESEWFELDRTRRSIRADQGIVRSTVEGAPPWSLRYSSLEPQVREDETLQVMREPVLVSGEEELRASWALFWIDPRRWGSLEPGALAPEASGVQRVVPRGRSLFGKLLRFEGIDWLRAVYLEGNVAYTLEGEGKARASAVYVDLIDGHGWLRDVNFETRYPFTRKRELAMKVRADWLRHSADGTYEAVGAVATTCSHEVPHYVVRVGELSIVPRVRNRVRRDPTTGVETLEEEFLGWDVMARKNQLRLWKSIAVPLPKIDVPIDPKYHVDTDRVTVLGVRPLSFGNDAKFGGYVGTSFSLDLSWMAKAFDYLLGGHGAGGQAGSADLNARWLNGRHGLLLGVAVPFYSPGHYWIDLLADGIFDNGEDKGLVRVPQDDRDVWRGWYRTVGRYLFGEREWIDVVGTYQSDPGFQAEFREGDYLRFEERESYLHYRKAVGDRAFAATIEAPPQWWRTEVVDQPSLTFYDGRSQVGTLGKVPILYGWRTNAGYFARVEGTGGYEDPFPDGLGEREVLRFDTRHRLEAPIDLSLAGLRATPWTEGSFTAWNEGADPDTAPARAGVLAGVDLATTFFRAFRNGNRHAISPSIGVRTDLVTSQDDVALVPIDRTELPLKGKFVDFGVRSRWTHAERLDTLDVELKMTHAADVEDNQVDGWLPLSTRGLWFSSVLGVPYIVSLDARYDLDDDRTEYSRTIFAFEPIPPVDIELGHHFGRDPLTELPLYEAVSAAAIWRFSHKWEVEGRQTVTTRENQRLSSGLLLRRIGHDWVFEVETRFVAGEGESLNFRFTPIILWDASGFSQLDRARRDPW